MGLWSWLLGEDLVAVRWRVFSGLILAFVLSSLIGLERERRQKSAGLRTHTLVGLGAALFMVVSKYGFGDLRGLPQVSLDPSRVAAQIVSGIGFIGGGLIFVRRDAVRGLTTAAVVWVTAAVGMACGAGLPLIAVSVTGLHFVALLVYTPLTRRFGRPPETLKQLRVTYHRGVGVLPQVLELCTRRGFAVVTVDASAGVREPGRDDRRGREFEEAEGEPLATVVLVLEGTGSLPDLIAELSEVEGVHQVLGGAVSEED